MNILYTLINVYTDTYEPDSEKDLFVDVCMCVCIPSYHLQPWPYMVKTYSAAGVVSSAVNIVRSYLCFVFQWLRFKWYTETKPVIA